MLIKKLKISSIKMEIILRRRKKKKQPESFFGLTAWFVGS